MPFYDYYCEANRRTVEVSHAMRERLRTWGEVCKKAGIPAGPTPATAPVVRMVSGITPSMFRCKGLDKDEPTKKMNI